MSGQWEVVGKKREKASKLPIVKSTNGSSKNKKNLASDVKLEDILPKTQVLNLYNSTKNNKENKKPVEKPKMQEFNTKKTQKKEKPQETVKPKQPKSIESALNAIDPDEFKNIFEKSQNLFPDAPIIWLKELLQFLNQKVSLEIQDPVFIGKKEGYPLNVVPSSIKGVIEHAVAQAGKDNIQLFFDICLTSMASDMSKDLPALGNKIFLQYIATTEPLLISANMNKYITLKKSYQNRPNIGMSILWAVGNIGANNFQSGLEVFQELFLPLLEMKNYSRFVVLYLLKLLKMKEGITITNEQFLLILDTIYTNKKNFPVDMKQELSEKLFEIKSLLFNNKKQKYQNFFEQILKKLIVNNNKSYQDCLCDILIEIFHKDETILANWVKVYPKNVATSAIILRYIGDNWNIVSKKISKSAFTKLLDSLKSYNEEFSSRKNVDGLKDAMGAIKKISDKMVAKKNSRSVFKTLFITFFLISQVILGVILYEAWKSADWDEIEINQKLKDLGIYPALEYLQKSKAYLGQGVTWVDDRLEENFPGYSQTIKDAVEPYVYLLVSSGKFVRMVVRNVKDLMVENYPVLLQSIEHYAPGLLENSQKAISHAYSTSLFYIHSSVDYLKKEVFIGQLSPENVQKVVSEAFNTTQQKASEYYHWIYEKVQTTIK